MLYDMHCHLDFADNSKEVASDAAGRIATVDSTVLPSNYVLARGKFEGFPDVRVALGIHPWWVADGRVGEVDIARFENLAAASPYIGEIGLDFHRGRKDSKPRQMEVFSRELQAIDDAGGGKLVFLHAVKCHDDIFKMLDLHGTAERNDCVFHWFQGSAESFERAVAAGCYFSVGMRMLKTASGREFIRAIPDDRLLVETDNPPHPGTPWSADAWAREIEDTIRGIAEMRGTTFELMSDVVSANSSLLLQRHDG